MNDTLPITRKALYQEVADRLRQRIFRHELAPGQWIDEQVIAAELGISRTPVREALKVLAAEGLVTLSPRRGSFVTQISDKDLDDIFSVLILLEGHAARLAAERIDEAGKARLNQLHERLEAAFRAQDIDGFFDANQAFHREVQRLSDNRWLLATIEDLRQKIKLSRHRSLFSSGRLEQSLMEHRALLQALFAGDSDASERLMREHLTHGRAAIHAAPRTEPAGPSAAHLPDKAST
ncbi:GntR family transcriptional regulator [Hydrogenophilus thermoluteolus]|uniref:Transcriptional regulator, GntR-family n=1 Tax=Hydrogenophilus thermoluteolus TaxID=297 RepID=A0A2Z6DVN9_HYDTE|nr:GntR family transcriptional regulator [Hydrogenophilus thermoluteolus]BBD76510.1 transcriptional regulator, GntR-family [Hydrogenophilus thermoluteolus]